MGGLSTTITPGGGNRTDTVNIMAGVRSKTPRLKNNPHTRRVRVGRQRDGRKYFELHLDEKKTKSC